jgi:trans-aconitate methyltransferase
VNQFLLDGGNKRHFREFLSGLEFNSVVDIGCGTGNWTTLMDKEPEYVGIDISQTCVDFCNKRFFRDRNKRFSNLDISTYHPEKRFDLAMLISVLHHLSDSDTEGMVSWISQNAKYVFVSDLYPNPNNPLSNWFYRMDRGEYIRRPEMQKKLFLKDDRVALIREADCFSYNRLYRHTLFLFTIQTEE